MSRKKKKASRKNSLEKTQEVLACFLGDLVSIYMFALIVVMPFYFTQGYKRIGTDKYEFLYNGSIIAGCIILPVWGIWLFLKIYGFWKEGERGKIVFWKNLSITDKFALGYAAVTILSYFNSVYREAECSAPEWQFLKQVATLAQPSVASKWNKLVQTQPSSESTLQVLSKKKEVT